MAAKVFTGTVSIDETAGGDQVIKAASISNRTRISAIWLDGTNLTDGATLKLFVDLGAAGGDSRQIADYNLVLAAGESVNLLQNGPIEVDTDIDIKLTSDAGGGGNVDVYYRIPYDDSIENLQSVFNGTGAADDVDLSIRSITVVNDMGHALSLDGLTYGLEVQGNTGGGYIHGAAEGTAFGLLIEGDGNEPGLKITAEGTQPSVDIDQTGTGKGIDINVTNGTGFDITTAGNNKAMDIKGAGSGNVIEITPGATGKGIYINATAGVAFDIQTGTAKAVEIKSNSGSQDAVSIYSDGGDGIGILTVNGHGIDVDCQGANKYGMNIDSDASIGLRINSDGTNESGVFIASGPGTGKGIYIDASGIGIDVDTNDGNAVQIRGGAAGAGVDIAGGLTGAGVNIAGGGTSGDAVNLTTTDGDGIKIVAAGTGKNAIDLSADNDGKALEINQKTKTGVEDIFELMYARLAGENQMANSGGAGEVEIELSNYAEDAVVKTLEIKKPDGSANTESLNVNALAGQAEA